MNMNITINCFFFVLGLKVDIPIWKDCKYIKIYRISIRPSGIPRINLIHL